MADAKDICISRMETADICPAQSSVLLSKNQMPVSATGHFPTHLLGISRRYDKEY